MALQDFLRTDAVTAAQRLLGCELVRQLGDKTVRVRIVETEAYDQTDPASHSFRGPTNRTAVMFGPAGYLYVYFTYGMHYCCNVVVGQSGEGAAVLLRAAEPLAGLSTMATQRPGASGYNFTNGPAKLCQALNITAILNGHSLAEPPLVLVEQPLQPATNIITTTRIGIKQATNIPRRFYLADSPWVSRW